MTKRSKPPIFIGGTGRSGTTILGRLLGSHSAVSLIPIETRFLVDGRGLLDLVDDPDRFPGFRKRVTGTWWRRTSAYGDSRGLHLMMAESELHEALADLEGSLRPDLILEGARRFADRILDAQLDGADTWVEMTPTTVRKGLALSRLYPDVRLVHIHRDGRDVACSVAKMAWGPRDPFEGLEWWADSLRRAARGSAGMDRSSLLHIELEDIVGPARDIAMETLLDFVGLEPDDEMTAYLEENITSDHAHMDRWMKDVGPERIDAFRARHREVVEDLARNGVTTGAS